MSSKIVLRHQLLGGLARSRPKIAVSTAESVASCLELMDRVGEKIRRFGYSGFLNTTETDLRSPVPVPARVRKRGPDRRNKCHGHLP